MRYIFTSLVVLCFPLAGLAQQSDAGFQRTSHVQEQSNELPNLSGKWAQKVVNSSISKVPVVGKVTTDSVGYLLLDIEQDADELTITSTVCDLRIDSSVKKVRTIVPDRFVNGLDSHTRRAKLERDDGQIRFVAPKKYTTVGVDLRNTQYETLPEDPDDPRVLDSDRDGHPGMTLRIEGVIRGELYVIQRAWDVMRGTLDGHRHIDGLIKWGNEQVLLDSSSIFLGSQPPSRPHPKAVRSYFRTTRLSDDATCRDVVDRRSSLFTRS